MVVYRKNPLYYLCCCMLLMGLCLPLCACGKKQNLVNTHKMPGHKFADLLNNSNVNKTTDSNSKGPLTRTKSGIYIYKDESTVNTSGYKFQLKDKTNVGPDEVRFDAEHFRTRY